MAFKHVVGRGFLSRHCGISRSFLGSSNEVNIMMKNLVDVVLGGVTYWAFGYGMSYGESSLSSWFMGWGSWFVDGAGVR